ncbi:DUF374 domain-containing protein [Mesorhizobium microcysteis]|jgi:lysophospholipid acyltransferase (LPLAT)-like uncharacterized protein|uniref:DUF374 domain-containing protein n=1 Tax=Neoaquamicrobium microcysteis TaxID=2682781 RepID=A0A5D4GUD6_9HYPH|nr:lysophospholipid acyltransferase family protein [Mesorhizobium microcysteis]TYR31987.1 DUF374 domain-containing protein [Mesorhizobium microcysteis]
MEENAVSPLPEAQSRRQKSRPGVLKSAWKKVRQPLVRSTFVKHLLATLIAGIVKFTYWTNPSVAGSDDPEPRIRALTPAIGALWHGQHLLGPAINPRHHKLVAMFSRSADAELNALVAQKLGFGIVRGSGGREDSRAKAEKGGARALITLKRTLDSGMNVAMIADIPHGTPREAGLGIVTLAKVSGRPIVPIAIATSRRKVLERSWDKTTINLPFGRRSLTVGEPIYVPSDAGPELMEEKRREVTAALNEATRRSYELVDAPR